jgi:ABC-type nickel/cobalt efflux system permease component RcnA
MENISILMAAITGLMAGALHVLTGADHLAAIAPLTADRPVKGWKLGLFWGIGHTGSVWLIGIFVFLLREMIPLEEISLWGERIVGVVLIGLGLWGFQKAVRTKVHYRLHDHGGIRHAHFHIREFSPEHPHLLSREHTHASFGIGILHGFAGSSHFIAILPALALPGTKEALAYIIAFGMGTIFAMTSFSWLIGTCMEKYMMPIPKRYQVVQVAFCTLAIGIGIYWIA